MSYTSPSQLVAWEEILYNRQMKGVTMVAPDILAKHTQLPPTVPSPYFHSGCSVCNEAITINKDMVES